MPPAFLELSVVLVIATILGTIAKHFKQPLILAYIFSGVLISIFGIFRTVDPGFLELLSNLGIAFLLFLVGVELKVDDFKYVGKAAILTGLGQIFFTVLVGFVLIAALGFSPVSSLYMAFAITFSSTVIIIKLLSEKHDLQSLYGKVTIGYLLVQDFVAIIALMIISGIGQNGQISLATTALVLFKGLLLLAFTIICAKWLLKFLFKLTAASTELLFVSAIAWAFLMAALGLVAGFSVAIGAFLAGVAIASSPYKIQISARVKPLRDFFTVLFFILLGASLSGGANQVLLSHVVWLSLFVVLGKPLIVFAVMLTLGFRNRTSFLVAVTGAQISEFSLILLASGQVLGHVTKDAAALTAAVAIMTITTSSYLIMHGEKIYRRLEKPLSVFFPQKKQEPFVTNREALKDHIVLVGAEQMGSDILKFLKSKVHDKSQIVVVDFNPEIINSLKGEGFNAVFGDISDPEVLEELELGRAKVVIITDPDTEDNALFIKFAKQKNFKGPIICTAYWIHDAVKLYENGADLVVVPEEIGGKHIASLLSQDWEHLEKIKKMRSKQFEELLTHKGF